MDTSILVVENTSNVDVENTSNMTIIMTPELQYMKIYTQEKNELKNTIALQSASIGKLLSEVEMCKSKFEAVFQQIV